MFVSDRRDFINTLACGVGGIGLASVFAEPARASTSAGSSKKPHHEPKAKSLIFLNMSGGPTQFETFDYKPEMEKWAGKSANKVPGGPPTPANAPSAPILAPLFKYVRKGESGVATTELFPHMAQVLDELCVIRTMHGDATDHNSARKQVMTGYARQPMPSLGSWILYGLGSENKNLPGFVYLSDSAHHGSGFLPGETQGMPVGTKVPNLKRPASLTERAQRDQLDVLAGLNRGFADRNPGTDALNARIEAAELAFRMQMACPEAVDLSRESQSTLDLYGIGAGKPGAGKPVPRSLNHSTQEFSAMCLTARRLVERGVRVVTIGVGNGRGWDQHALLREAVQHNSMVIDQGMAALIADLKRTGLLDSTLVMWGGEFGRTPYSESNGNGRDHFAKAFTYWLAGGGSKKGQYYGETDEIGRSIVRDPVHIHDLHATVLHLMGLDPEKHTFRYGGRDQRLTDLSGKVVPGIIA
jgi:hypothetical protein